MTVIKEIDEKIKACFPHPSFRPGQLDLIREAITALDGGAKNVICEAPTGVGKTPAILTLARYYTPDYALARADANKAMLDYGSEREGLAKAQEILAPQQAHMITSLKMLQDQYLRDDTARLVQIMKGKGNYACHSPSVMPGSSCADYEAMFGGQCSRSKHARCVYVQARTAAQFARLTLHNFDSFLSQASLGGSFIRRAILTVDEAHGADDHLIRAMSFELSAEMLQKHAIKRGWKPPPDLNLSADVKEWITDMDKAIGERSVEIDNEISRLQTQSSFRTKQQDKELAGFGRGKQALAEVKRKLMRYLNSAEKPWSIDIDNTGTVKFEPVRASFFAKTALLDFGERRVFMSATIFDGGKRLMWALNMKKDETHYIRAPCIFPVAKRPLVDMATADTGQENYTKAKPRLFAEIERIMEKHAGQRGVIHCNSYQMARDVRDNVNSRRLVFHEPSEREDAVKRFMAMPKDSDRVLIGVFLREGYDFKDDIARFQVMLRLPYPWPDKRMKMREEMEPGYYDWLTAIDLIQTYGRGVRNEQDWCTTYMLDSRLRKFLRRAGYMMPKWFLDAVVTARSQGWGGLQLSSPATPKQLPAHDDFE